MDESQKRYLCYTTDEREMREIHGTICQIAAGGETGRETSIATENEKKKGMVRERGKEKT